MKIGKSIKIIDGMVELYFDAMLETDGKVEEENYKALRKALEALREKRFRTWRVRDLENYDSLDFEKDSRKRVIRVMVDELGMSKDRAKKLYKKVKKA